MSRKVFLWISAAFALWAALIIMLLAVGLANGAANRPAIREPDAHIALRLPTRTPSPTATQPVAGPPSETLPANTRVVATTSTPAPSASATPLAIVPGVPVGIQIPAIALSATVEAVGLTADLAMAAPAAWDAVGWYQYGYWVGEAGNAVLTGHLDTNAGAPAVFWNLGDLEIGDPIWIGLHDGQQMLFDVIGLEDFEFSDAPLESIFGPADTPQLRLITCSGSWQPSKGRYDRRLVVTAQLVVP